MLKVVSYCTHSTFRIRERQLYATRTVITITREIILPGSIETEQQAIHFVKLLLICLKLFTKALSLHKEILHLRSCVTNCIFCESLVSDFEPIYPRKRNARWHVRERREQSRIKDKVLQKKEKKKKNKEKTHRQIETCMYFEISITFDYVHGRTSRRHAQCKFLETERSVLTVRRERPDSGDERGKRKRESLLPIELRSNVVLVANNVTIE